MSEKPVDDVIDRPTARVLLLDPSDRILLMKGRLPGFPPGGGAWFTIGGGLEPGETYLEAAAREIGEETGIVEFTLGPVVWVREGVLRASRPLLMREQYVVARCADAEPDVAGWTEIERELIDEIRWWTLQELLVTAEPVFPPGLARLLPPILAGDFPTAPLAIPWA